MFGLFGYILQFFSIFSSSIIVFEIDIRNIITYVHNCRSFLITNKTNLLMFQPIHNIINKNYKTQTKRELELGNTYRIHWLNHKEVEMIFRTTLQSRQVFQKTLKNEEVLPSKVVHGYGFCCFRISILTRWRLNFRKSNSNIRKSNYLIRFEILKNKNIWNTKCCRKEKCCNFIHHDVTSMECFYFLLYHYSFHNISLSSFHRMLKCSFSKCEVL